VSAATVNNPTDGTTGYICPVGHYCPAGASAETPCLLGSYRSTTGATAPEDCTVCSGAEICNARGLSASTGYEIICVAGNYCPSSLETYPCEPGYFCIQNVEDQSVCADGYYQPNAQ